MTVQDLISKKKHEVRKDNALMLLYLQEFEKIFGRKPDCAGCTFNRDWERFKTAVQNSTITTTLKTNTIMAKSEKTFELNPRERNTIFTYTDNGRPVRSYGWNMTEDFAKKLLSTGTKEQIAERKKAFKTLPGESTTEAAKIEVNGEDVLLSKATGAQMDAYAEANSIDFGDASKVDQKRAVIEKSL